METRLYLTQNLYLLDNGNNQLDPSDSLVFQSAETGSQRATCSDVQNNFGPAELLEEVQSLNVYKVLTRSSNNLSLGIHQARRLWAERGVANTAQETQLQQNESAVQEVELNRLQTELHLYLNRPGHRPENFQDIQRLETELSDYIAQLERSVRDLNALCASESEIEPFSNLLQQAQSLKNAHSEGFRLASSHNSLGLWDRTALSFATLFESPHPLQVGLQQMYGSVRQYLNSIL